MNDSFDWLYIVNEVIMLRVQDMYFVGPAKFRFHRFNGKRHIPKSKRNPTVVRFLATVVVTGDVYQFLTGRPGFRRNATL
jgi:hypothetical protein